ncbi:hypothetical protein SRHO_G00154930 [Serrasalmus rhombeus]
MSSCITCGTVTKELLVFVCEWLRNREDLYRCLSYTEAVQGSRITLTAPKQRFRNWPQRFPSPAADGCTKSHIRRASACTRT